MTETVLVQEAVDDVLEGFRLHDQATEYWRSGVRKHLQKNPTIDGLVEAVDQIRQSSASCREVLKKAAADVRGFDPTIKAKQGKRTDLKGSGIAIPPLASFEQLSSAMPTQRSARAYRKSTPETKEKINEEVMSNPEAQYTPDQIEALEEYLESLREDNQRLEQENARLQKECGEVFDPDVARRHRVERIGNHLVMGLGSDIFGDINRFHSEEEFYHPSTRKIIRSHCQRLLNFFVEEMGLIPHIKPKDVPDWQDIGKPETEIHTDRTKTQSHYQDPTK